MDLNTPHVSSDPADGQDYTNLEVVLWVLGILMIPLVPILMVAFFTPFSGIGN